VQQVLILSHCGLPRSHFVQMDGRINNQIQRMKTLPFTLSTAPVRNPSRPLLDPPCSKCKHWETLPNIQWRTHINKYSHALHCYSVLFCSEFHSLFWLYEEGQFHAWTRIVFYTYKILSILPSSGGILSFTARFVNKQRKRHDQQLRPKKM